MSKTREEKKAYAKAYYIANKVRVIAQIKVWNEAHKEEIKAYARAYYFSHLDKIRAYRASRKDQLAAYLDSTRKQRSEKSRIYKEAHKEHIRDYKLGLKYGISGEKLDSIFCTQGGVCAICGTREWAGRNKSPVVDHDHITGKVRGLLCSKCNFALGHLKDSIPILERAIEYLRRSA